MNELLQIPFFLGSALAIWWVNQSYLPYRRAGQIVGLLTQPVAAWVSWTAEPTQWATIILSFWFAWAYGSGFLKSRRPQGLVRGLDKK